MSYDGLLTNKCDIVRPTIAKDHGAQEKTYDTSSPTHEDVACLIQYITGPSLRATPHGYETVEGWYGFFEYGQDVLKDDLLVDDLSREFIVLSAPEDVAGQRHHIECRLDIRE